MAEKSRRGPARGVGARKKLKGKPRKAKPLVCPGLGCSVPERIAWIAHLMARSEWLGRRSLYELSQAWALDMSTVRKASAEASRRLQAEPDQLESERERFAEEAAEVKVVAKRSRNKMTGLPDFASWLKAIELQGRYRGIDPDAPLAEVPGRAITALRIILEGGEREPADVAC